MQIINLVKVRNDPGRVKQVLCHKNIIFFYLQFRKKIIFFSLASFGNLSNHIVENSSMFEICQFQVSVKPHDHGELLS